MHVFVAVFCTARGERGCTVGGCFRDVRSLLSGTHHRLVPRMYARPEDVQIEEKKIGIKIGGFKRFSTSSCLKEMSFWRRLVVWLDI